MGLPGRRGISRRWSSWLTAGGTLRPSNGHTLSIVTLPATIENSGGRAKPDQVMFEDRYKMVSVRRSAMTDHAMWVVGEDAM